MADNVQEWFKFARKDLYTAEALIALGNDHFDFIVFLSQQCAEKSVKGYLKYLNIKYPKIHDIKVLGSLIPDPNSQIQAAIRKAHLVTHYVARYRYPSLADQILTKTAVDEALEIAKETYKFFLSQVS